jgi:proline dehydrogenase
MMVFARTALLATLVIFGALFTNREAAASAAVAAAAQAADAGVTACGNNSGRALDDCLANVLDKLSNEVTSPTAQSALHAAAAKLRAAVSKVQALSAIAQCRALIASAISEVRATGGDVAGRHGGKVGGGGGPGSGLEAVAAVLGHAAKLIQAKG